MDSAGGTYSEEKWTVQVAHTVKRNACRFQMGNPKEKETTWKTLA
jgi:hypothetical protein